MVTQTERDAMGRALALATQGPFGPNPRVGCVLLDEHGTVVGEGFHRGAGTAHAEVDALANAARAAHTAVVTLEPCDHTGRTGPCTQALIAAGVRRVVVERTDPNPEAAGGAQTLRAAGLDVVVGPFCDDVPDPNRVWSQAMRLGRPFVTWKLATTIDGRSAAADGTSRWITGEAARADVHRLRGEVDTILVGTGTALVDDPQLTVRDGSGRTPLRAVMGLRHLPSGARVLDDTAPTVVLPTREPREALEQLWGLERRHVLLEGGPTLAAAFLREGLVDEIVAYVAPVLLGSGRSALADLGITTIADAVRPEVTDVTVLGSDVRITLAPARSA